MSFLFLPLAMATTPLGKSLSALPALALPRYKLIFFVPPSALQACKSAIFAAGAGRHPSSTNPIPGNLSTSNFTSGSSSTSNFTPTGTAGPSATSAEEIKYTYTECCWTTLGTGQFRPGDGANPHLGSVGTLEEVEEARCEVLCVGEDVARRAVGALRG